MTQRERVWAGVGGIAFTVLTVAGLGFASTPGGGYDASSIADYVAKGHRTSVFVALALALLGVLALLVLLVGLRDRLAERSLLASVFSATSLVSITGFAIGWAAWLTPPLAIAIGGSSVLIDPKVTYVILQVGGIIVFGIGGIFLGVTLIALMIGSSQTLPAWFRWFTLVVGVLALASPAWLPFFPLLLWGLVAGIWLVASGRNAAPVAEPQPAA
jgi:hypothetical protein